MFLLLVATQRTLAACLQPFTPLMDHRFPQSLCRLPLLTQLELVNCKLGERGLLDPLPGLLADLPLAFLSLGGNGLDQVWVVAMTVNKAVTFRSPLVPSLCLSDLR